MKRLRFKSLRARLTFWFLAVTMLSLATAGTVLYFQRAAVIHGNEFEKLQTVRDLKVNALNQWLDERMDDLAVSAGDDEVRSLEAILAENGSERDSKKVLVARALLQRYLDNYGAYSELFIVSATSGEVVISTDLAQEGKDKQTDLYFTEPMRTKKMYIKDIFYSEIEKRPTMVFSAPIFSLVHGGEHLVGVLVARVDLEQSLYPLLQNRTGMGETGETLIVNKDGVALNELRWYENAPLKLKISAQPSVRAAAGKTGIIEDLDYRGEMVLAAYTHIPRTQWGFVAKRDLAEVYAPIRDLLHKLLFVFGFTALVVTLVSLLLSKTLSRPILGVGDAVRRFANGELDARCSINGTDEVAALGTAFNEMVATLSSQMAIRKGYAELSETLVIADKIKDFASGLLMKLIDLSGSQLGAFYLRSENGAVFEQIASVGLSGDTPQSFSAEGYEGELGKAIATGQISLVREISADTVFTFKTTGGTAIPREILTVPLLVGRQVMGVVSLATLSAFPDTFRQILDLAQIGMGTAFSNLLASVKTQRLAEELHTNNTELQAQAVEMEQQTQELQQQAVELEAQQQQVEAANRLKSEFLSNMSHELRTPLNSVLSLSQLMLSNGIGSRGGEDKERVEIIERNGRHLLNLINDILDISKIEAGRMDLYVSSFAVEETVEAVVEAIRPLANQKGVSISVEVGALGELQTDQDKLKQILLNLMSNAQKFTEKGEIGIKARQDGRSVVISVWDTGIGIPEQALSHIFDEFRQADGSTTRQYGGTGLGLTISRRLAALLGGRIDVESEEGTGSTFTLTLPMHIESQDAHVEQKPAGVDRVVPNWPAGSPPPRILLVEDNQVARAQITSVLTASGFVVDVAANGEEGLAQVRDHVPAGMILDLMMPKVDGFQVLESIRSTPATKKLPVLVLTAKDLTAAERASLSYNNVHQLIQKGSLDRTQLISAIRRLIGMKELPAVKKRVMEKPVPRVIPRKDGALSILIVDDHADNLTTTRHILNEAFRNRPLEIFEARNGKEAVAVAKAEHPNLILMDIQMPIMGGMEAAQQIKQDETLQNTVIIALTASAMPGERENILAAGCDDYLSKPAEPAALNAMIRKWMGGENA
jgi:signal transduction histidine kinase/CheY-like chemotaxis protein/HAMP domain-containing protein